MSELSLSEFERVAALIAQAGEQIAHLPAIPVRDWPDRAARCLGRMCAGAQVVVQVSKLDEHGGILRSEATGVAGEGLDADEISLLRSRADRLTSLGFHIDLNILQARPLVGAADVLAAGRDWRTGSLGRLFSSPGIGYVIAGVCALGNVDPGRSLIALVALPPGNRDLQTIKVRAVMGVLQHRARMALGEKPTVNSDWVTEKEQKVLDRLIQGESVREIAERTDRSQYTVHDHVKALHRKLDASSRGELISRALGFLALDTAPRRGEDAIREVKPAAAD
ncbi:MAG: helix-turn-helix transcriptional regulator [Phycisphaerales bacterium]|nr:helix-turn-helix transcriptional regulator [Phycisphaerales bacterium]